MHGERLDGNELAEWHLLESIDPFGQLREDWRAAQIAATTARVHGSDVTAGELLLAFEPSDETEYQSVEQMRDVLTKWAEAHNARLKASGDGR